MKYLMILLVILTGATGLAGETEEIPPRQEPFRPLAERFLAALKSEKLEDAMACWASVEQLKEYAENQPAGHPGFSEQRIERMVTHLRERDEVIKKRLPKLIEALKANNVAPKSLTYSASYGGMITERGNWKSSRFLSMWLDCENGNMVLIHIDGTFNPEGKWYLSDKPEAYFQLWQGTKEPRKVVFDK